MPDIYLTPASISYLAQLLLLSLTMTVYLLLWGRQRKTQSLLAIGFIFFVSMFSALMFFDTAFLPTPRLYAVYLENPALAVALVFLLQFVYRFPVMFESRKWEARILLILSAAYTFYEINYAIFRFSDLRLGVVNYRAMDMDYYLAALFIWIPIAFLRQSLLADESPRLWVRKLLQPQGAGARSARSFAVIFLIPLGLGIVNILRSDSAISATAFNILLSLGILGSLWLLSIVYINAQPVATSFLVKLSGTTLTFLLAILGAAIWVITPAHIASYHLHLNIPQSLRYTPNPLGGYDIEEIPFYFESNIGTELPVTSRGDGRSYKVNFIFPFYGKTYSDVYVTSVGLVKMGGALYHPSLQYHYGQFPAIFALLIDMEPDSPGGVFARVEGDRLIITWNEMLAVHQPRATFTFQAVLYRDGRFDLNYKDLPADFTFNPDASPSSNIWLRGATSGTSDPVLLAVQLPLPVRGGTQGILQDFNVDFREYIHKFTLPMGWLLLISSFFLFFAVPVALNTSIVRPLKRLLEGVRHVDEGNLDVEVPIQHYDEIGMLTQSFNNMAVWLNALINNLEQRVAERTADLELANANLQREMSIRQESQAQLMEQQRKIAILDERDHATRSLHDGVAQMMSSINLQTQAAQTFFENRQTEAGNASLENIKQISQEAALNIRSFILGLRKARQSGMNFFEFIREYLKEYSAATGVRTNLSLPASQPFPVFPAAVEEKIFRIIQEAFANIRKHARANRVDVIFSAHDQNILLVISDDGVGFDMRQQPSGEDYRFGLNMMRERVQSFGGKMEMRSAPGDGTRILISIPRASGNTTPQSDSKDLNDLRILLVDDSPIFLEGLRSLLTARGLTVVGAALDGLEAQEKACQLRPDLMIIDIAIPRCNGVEAALAIKTEFPRIKIAMLTSSENEEQILEAIKNGASAFILKNSDVNQFFESLNKLAFGGAVIPPAVATRLAMELPKANSAPLAEGLSERQRQVLEFVANGMTYKEVGHVLNLSENTVKYHMKQILDRLQLKRSQAIAFVKRSPE